MIGISYGIKKIHISIISNLLISLIIFIFTALSMYFGESLAAFVPIKISSVIGAVIVIGIGTSGLIKYMRNKSNQTNETLWPVKNPEKYDQNHDNEIEYRETFLLGLALSVNNIGLGIGASISGLHVLPTAVTTFIFSIIFLSSGHFLGNGFFAKIAGKYVEPVAAVIIIILGVCELFF